MAEDALVAGVLAVYADSVLACIRAPEAVFFFLVAVVDFFSGGCLLS
jgi:hypothetical protein